MKAEELFQLQVCDYLRILELQKRIVTFFSVPNHLYLGNSGKTANYVAKQKRLGMKVGVSDLVVVGLDKVVFLELKAKGGKQSEAQKEFQKIIDITDQKYDNTACSCGGDHGYVKYILFTEGKDNIEDLERLINE